MYKNKWTSSREEATGRRRVTARSSFVSRQAACNGWRCDFLPILLLSIDAHTRITSPGHIQVERDLLIFVRDWARHDVVQSNQSSSCHIA